MSGNEVNWNNIRMHAGSQDQGFEELCCQLFHSEMPNGAQFERRGYHDAGLECAYIFPYGSLHGIQAKDLLEKIGTTSLLDLRDRAMLSLMIRTGLRRMDVIQATVGALSRGDGHTVLRVIGKRKKERIIKIPVDVVRTLEAWREAVRPLREETPTTPHFCGLAR